MPIRPEPILVAARRWLELLPANGEPRTRTTFATVSRYSDLTSTQYESAFQWLRSAGLLDEAVSPIPVNHRILIAAIETSDAAWLPNADEFADDPQLLPDEVGVAAEALEIDHATASGYVHAAWGKIDLERRQEIGSAGERAVVELVETNTNAKVEHVALWTDGLGYDISVLYGDLVGHLEVKATTRRHRLTVHLSRNEFRTAQRDPAWILVAARLDPVDFSLQSVATVESEWFAKQMPQDSGGHGAWTSCRVDVPSTSIQPGLGFLTPLFEENDDELQRLFGWPEL